MAHRARRPPSPPPPPFPLSSFAWLTSLLVASALLRPWAPLAGRAAAAAVLTVVACDAATLRGLWLADRYLRAALQAAAGEAGGHRPVTGEDAARLALAHGLAHGLTHAVLLYLR